MIPSSYRRNFVRQLTVLVYSRNILDIRERVHKTANVRGNKLLYMYYRVFGMAFAFVYALRTTLESTVDHLWYAYHSLSTGAL